MAKKTEAVVKAVEELVAKVEDICRACWPDGWPHRASNAECEHGAFTRPDPAGDPTPTSPTPPAPETPADPAAAPADPAATQTPEPPTGGTDPETTPKEPTT